MLRNNNKCFSLVFNILKYKKKFHKSTLVVTYTRGVNMDWLQQAKTHG